MAKIVSVVFITVLISSLECARILAVLPAFTKSPHRFHQSVLKVLARAEHEVVVYSPFPLDQPLSNYTEVVMDNVQAENEKITQVIQKIVGLPHRKCYDLHEDIFSIEFEDFVNSNHIKTLLKSDTKFDLVFLNLFAAQEFTVIFSHKFKVPIINLQAFPTNSILNAWSGNLLASSTSPDACSPFSDNMTFYERLLNSFYHLRNIYYVYFNSYIPLVEDKWRLHFPDAPPLQDLLANVSLTFVNDHRTADYASARTPNIVSVAGIHIQETRPLPKTIQKFMDEATDGVILFSLGTYIRDDFYDKDYFEMYIKVFSQLRQRVLWKSRSKTIQGVPANVMILNWVPQQDILAHPKMVLFMTHGGLQSQHETVHNGVPVVVIPQFYDQHRNAKFYEEKGIGVKLDKAQLSDTSILKAIRTVLDNSQFTTNAKKLSAIFRDRLMTPAETVVYWTEHVLRHGGSHLKPVSANLAWYQLILLDVLVAILSVCVMIYFIIRTMFRFICRGRKQNNKLSQRKKRN